MIFYRSIAIIALSFIFILVSAKASDVVDVENQQPPVQNLQVNEQELKPVEKLETGKRSKTELSPFDEKLIVNFLKKLGRKTDRDEKGNFLGLAGMGHSYYPTLIRILKNERLFIQQLLKWSAIRNFPKNTASLVVTLPCGKKISNSPVFWPQNESLWIKNQGLLKLVNSSRTFTQGLIDSINSFPTYITPLFCIYQIVSANPFDFWSLFQIIDNRTDTAIKSFIQLLGRYPWIIGGIIPSVMAVPIVYALIDIITAKSVTDLEFEKAVERIGQSCKRKKGGKKTKTQEKTPKESETGDKKTEKSVIKERGPYGKLWASYIAPLGVPPLELCDTPLNPTAGAIGSLVRLLLWDENLTDPTKRAKALLSLQNLFDRGSLLERILAADALALIASGVNVTQYTQYRTETDSTNEFAIRDLVLRVRALQALLTYANRNPFTVWKEKKGILDGVAREILWGRTLYNLWDIGYSPSLLLSGAFLSYNVIKTALGYTIVINFFRALDAYLKCPDRAFSFEKGDYPPTSLDYTPKCWDAFKTIFNQIPGQPGYTLTADLSKFHFPDGTLRLDLSPNCAKTPITAENIAGILDGIKQNKPGLRLIGVNIAGCDLSDSNGLNGTLALGRALSLHTDIQYLNMSDNSIGSPAEWLASLGNLTRLEILDLRRNRISTSALAKLPQSLKELYISDNPIEDHLPDLISGVCKTNMTRLEFSQTCTFSTNPRWLNAGCLKSIPLQVLVAPNNYFSASDAITFGDALSPTLLELDINNSPLPEASVPLFIQNLRRLSRLRILKMAGIPLESPGKWDGTLALSQNFPPRAEWLDLEATQIGLTSDGRVLFEVFPGTLKTLMLGNNPIQQVQYLIPTITSGNLTTFSLKGAQVQDPTQVSLFIQALAKAQKNQTLIVDVSYNNFGQTLLDDTTLSTMGQVFSPPTMTLFPQWSPIPPDQLARIYVHINDRRSRDQLYLVTPQAIDKWFLNMSSSTTTFNLAGRFTDTSADVDTSTLGHLMERLKTFPTTDLDMSGNNFDLDYSRTGAIANVGFPPNLRVLNFGGNIWLGTATQNLTETWRQLYYLERLILRNSAFTPRDAQKLKSVLMSLAKLKEFDCTGCQFDTQSRVEILESFDRSKNPTTVFNPKILRLASIGLGSEVSNPNDTIALSHSLGGSSIEILDVSSPDGSLKNSITPDVISALPPTIQDINVESSELAVGTVQVLGKSFKNKPSLKSINLGKVTSSDPQFWNTLPGAFTEAFQGGLRPESLKLPDTGLGMNETETFKFMQSLPPSLKILDLSGNPLEKQGSRNLTQALGVSIRGMQDLQTLVLSTTGLGSVDGNGFRTIGTGITNKTKLRHVDITGNIIANNPDVNAGILNFLDGIVDPSHPCIVFNSCPIPSSNSSWGTKGALGTTYTLNRKPIIKSCEEELCFKTPIVFPSCNSSTNSTTTRLMGQQPLTSSASQHKGFIVSSIDSIRSLFKPSERTNKVKTHKVRMRERIKESSPKVLFPKPSSWLDRIDAWWGQKVNSLREYLKENLAEGNAAYFPQNTVMPLYWAQNPYNSSSYTPTVLGNTTGQLSLGG